MKRLLSFLILPILFFNESCSMNEKDFLRDAWETGEQEEFINYIENNLKNENNFARFIQKTLNLQYSMEFVFGYLDVNDGVDNFSISEELNVKTNILKVTEAFINSSAFNCKTMTYDKRMYIQNTYFKRSVLSNSELREIEVIFNKPCGEIWKQ